MNTARTDDGTTPLFLSACTSNSHEGVVKQLLKAGADVDKATTDDGNHSACLCGTRRPRARG